MTGLTVTPITVPTVTAWQITTASAQDAVAAINTLLLNGYKVQINPANNNGALSWSLTITNPAVMAQPIIANSGDWIVINGTQLTKCTNVQFLAMYTANVDLVWAATSVPPVATATSDSTATIVFPQPTSVNGPWTYTATQTDSTTTGDTTLSGDPSIDGSGNVTLTAINLTDDVSFTVTCSTQYEGIAATSLPTATITAE